MSFATVALAVWFGMYALLTLTDVKVEQQKLIMGVLAAIVCILLFVGDRVSWRKSPPAA